MNEPTLATAVLVAGLLGLAAVIANRVTHRLGVPALLVFLAIGMVAGSEGPGGITFYNAQQAQDIGSVALLVILFAGGLMTPWRDVRPVLAPGITLATMGVLITAAIFAVFAWWALGTYESFEIGRTGLTWPEAFLLAAMVSSTDAAAVFAAFGNRPVRPKRRIRSLLELESGSNDPMAVVLTTTIIVALTASQLEAGAVVGHLASEIVLGLLIGVSIGAIGAAGINRVNLPADGLYPVLVLSLGLVSFGATGLLGGSPYLAVYLTGLVLGNRLSRAQGLIKSFHDGLSWLAQITVFVLLGLLVTPSELPPVAPVAIVLAGVLALVARPLAVWLCLAPFRYPGNEKAFVSWAGLKGAVPIVLATFPMTAGLQASQTLFNVVFFIVIASVLVQGLTLTPSVRWARVAEGKQEGSPAESADGAAGGSEGSTGVPEPGA